MTNREFYTAIINYLDGADMDGEAVQAFACDALAKLDHTNEVRKVAAAKKAAEKQELKAPVRCALFEALSEEPMTATMLVEAVKPDFDVKPASIPSLLRPFVDKGEVLKVDVKVPGKGTQRGYVKA